MLGLTPTRSIARFLHAALLAAAYLVFARTLVLPAGLVFGAVGAVCGTYLAERVIRARYRLGAVSLMAAGIFFLGLFLSQMLVGSHLIADALTPVTTLHVAEVRWFFVVLCVCLIVRAAALRYDAALAVEGLVVVFALAKTVEAHRDGMIARPLEVADWFWTQGIDPVQAFLGLGIIAAMLLCGVFIYGRRLVHHRDLRSGTGRTFVQLTMVLCLGIFLASRIHSRDDEIQRKNAIGDKAGTVDNKKEDEPGYQGSHEGSPRNGDQSDGMPPPGGKKKNRPAAVVIFHKDVQPMGGVFYFRHGTFSQFNGVRLVETTRSDVDLDARHQFPTDQELIQGAHNEGDARTLVATDVALLTKHSRLFALVDPTEISAMPNPDSARFRRAYRVVSNVVSGAVETLIGREPGDPKWSDEVWEYYTAIPKDDRYHRLAAEIASELRPEFAQDPLARAYAVKQYLEKNTIYSFKRNYQGADDPTAEFLFSEDKKGYCVHLAHSAAYLARSLGIPARVSAGYAVPAKNLGGGSALLIKSGDAHAWAEIFLRGVGWVPVEVTPERTEIQPPEFNEKDLQQLLGEMARKEGRFERDSYQGPRLGDFLKQFWAAVPWALLCLIAMAYLIKLWRLWCPSFAGQRARTRVAYRAALDRLSAVGLIRSRGESPQRFAGRVAKQAESFEPLAEARAADAFGSRRFSPLVEHARMALKVGSELRRSTPAWRWALGVLNPVSWWWSR